MKDIDFNKLDSETIKEYIEKLNVILDKKENRGFKHLPIDEKVKKLNEAAIKIGIPERYKFLPENFSEVYKAFNFYGKEYKEAYIKDSDIDSPECIFDLDIVYLFGKFDELSSFTNNNIELVSIIESARRNTFYVELKNSKKKMNYEITIEKRAITNHLRKVKFHISEIRVYPYAKFKYEKVKNSRLYYINYDDPIMLESESLCEDLAKVLNDMTYELRDSMEDYLKFAFKDIDKE